MFTRKKILDVCCGSKMFWFEKNNPNVLFSDIRKEDHTLFDGRRLNVDPDLIADFRNLPFEDEKFNLVVFDPPHLKNLGQNTWMAKTYGVLGLDWKNDIKQGFNECFRVLKKEGVLIFKWSEVQLKVNQVIDLSPVKPLFGTRTGKSNKTIWLCFMKEE